ncbi:NAD(P)H-hydrate dehydratase, partial [Sporichthya sp.]|uniref:NAD(P)H-hydrate dehydratase n=1 Tax=Sporichthya sp. TaxID=65475 RepID=UPI00183DD0A7
GLAALCAAGGRVTGDPAALDRADLVLDGIVGIGASGGLRPEAAALVNRAAAGPGLLVAVDVPSGVDADTAEVPGAAVTADATVTFGTWKPALLADPAAGRAGAPTLVDIGLEPYLPDPAVLALQHADVAALLPVPARTSDKYRRGVVGICAGSATYPGAAVLAVAGALHGGAGMVRFAGPEPAAAAVRARWPESVVTTGAPSEAGRVQAWVVGPGIGTDAEARSRLEDVLRSDVPVLVDADGLTLLAGTGPLRRAAPTLLSPHAGELGRLLKIEPAEAEAGRLGRARAAAQTYGATVLLKGSTTVIAPAPGPGDGPAYVNPTGSGWLATAGSGDVLAGLAGALLAAGLEVTAAGAVAAYLHGAAARTMGEHGHGGGAPVTSMDVAAALPAVWREMTAS